MKESEERQRAKAESAREMRAGSRRWLWCLGMFLRFFFLRLLSLLLREDIIKLSSAVTLTNSSIQNKSSRKFMRIKASKKRKRREVTNSKNPAVYTNIILRSSTFFSYVSFSLFLIDRSRAKNSTFMWWRKISFNVFFFSQHSRLVNSSSPNIFPFHHFFSFFSLILILAATIQLAYMRAVRCRWRFLAWCWSLSFSHVRATRWQNNATLLHYGYGIA